MKIAFLYTVFAVIATAANILFQELSLRLYQGELSLYSSILCGTITGLVIKFQLDKYYIFNHQSQDISENTRLFFLYSVMGIATTLIFWSTELIFEWIFNEKSMRYLGACIGLSIGYLSKYQLDKHFVFSARLSSA